MTAPASALKGVIAALVTTFDAALSIPVHRHRPVGSQPDRAYLIVGADFIDGDSNAGTSATEYAGATGLGQRARNEMVYVPCMAVYRDVTEEAAVDGALDLYEDAAAALVASPKLGLGYAYNALAVRVDRTHVVMTRTGRMCALTFTVQVKARLV